MKSMNRRHFLNTTTTFATALAVASPIALSATKETPTAKHLPRWRGFNLLEKFVARGEGNPPFRESDFELMAEWGFDFARLPMSYLCWASHE